MKKTTRVALIAITSATSACGLIPNESAYRGFGIKALPSKNETPYLVEKYTSCIDKLKGPGPINENIEKQCTNISIIDAISKSNEICATHLRDIYGNDAAFNIATGSFATLSSGAASITDGGSAKLLAALSTFFNAERSLVNETIYKNQVTTHIGIKISQSRETAGAVIRAGLAPTATYSFAQASFDLDTFHNSCSFYHGLQKVLEEGTKTSPSTRLSQLEIEREYIMIRMTSIATKQGDKKNSDDVYLSLKERLKALGKR